MRIIVKHKNKPYKFKVNQVYIFVYFRCEVKYFTCKTM